MSQFWFQNAFINIQSIYFVEKINFFRLDFIHNAFSHRLEHFIYILSSFCGSLHIGHLILFSKIACLVGRYLTSKKNFNYNFIWTLLLNPFYFQLKPIQYYHVYTVIPQSSIYEDYKMIPALSSQKLIWLLSNFKWILIFLCNTLYSMILWLTWKILIQPSIKKNYV